MNKRFITIPRALTEGMFDRWECRLKNKRSIKHFEDLFSFCRQKFDDNLLAYRRAVIRVREAAGCRGIDSEVFYTKGGRARNRNTVSRKIIQETADLVMKPRYSNGYEKLRDARQRYLDQCGELSKLMRGVETAIRFSPDSIEWEEDDL